MEVLFMGRKRLEENLKKIKLTIRIKKELIDKLRKIDNYNKFIENWLKRN
jgi:hypothetical protein